MPEFILDHGTPEAAALFASLNPFEQGYVECMFFTSASDPDDADLAHATFAELAPQALADAREDCENFRMAVGYSRRGPGSPFGPAGTRWEMYIGDKPYTDHQAGVDFWFTRNGHGAGFWDRGLGEVGEHLSKIAKTFGTRDLYRGDDGLIYTTS